MPPFSNSEKSISHYIQLPIISQSLDPARPLPDSCVNLEPQLRPAHHSCSGTVLTPTLAWVGLATLLSGTIWPLTQTLNPTSANSGLPALPVCLAHLGKGLDIVLIQRLLVHIMEIQLKLACES